ncbi:U exon protein [Fowl aviadenovirus E]|uniref:U exon n=2 Tax=Fowl aviadenovirus E TaxID=190065 RepID=E9KLB2_9ADEN|nr:U exon [Fowl aviadenovirus E]ANA50323.1 U exon protein [Fowl adenovirus 8b]ADE58405.1 U exon [Fowl aviadenovirus E]AOC84077.1 U exon protein [Fowl aviadenovirus E]AOS87883.1 U exon [Fowl aviadenovirus E]UWT60597.1 U exon [Fowl adenovirus 8b]
MSETESQAPKKYWLKVNDQAIVRFAQPLNPGYVFWIKRRFRARVVSDGGERVTITRREPFSEAELEELYCETEHRQQRVSRGEGLHQSQNTSSYALVPL